MSVQDKIKDAKQTTWLSDGLPKWQIKLIVWSARVKAKIYRSNKHDCKRIKG